MRDYDFKAKGVGKLTFPIRLTDPAGRSSAGEFSFWLEGRARATYGTLTEICQAGGKAFSRHGGNDPAR